ncbi:MAG: hypothetical protein AAFW73_21830 [Bacteroidota bacterium]
MKKYLFPVLLALLVPFLFTACQGDGETGREDYCYFAVRFDIVRNDCAPGQFLGFTLRFIDDAGTWYDFDYVLPDIEGNPQIVGLPSGQPYEAYVLNNGVQNGCGESIYFEVTVIDPDAEQECFSRIVDIDERPEACCSNPDLEFALPKSCENCIEIVTEETCYPELCGGNFSGQYDGGGFYVYPIEELYTCPDCKVTLIGTPIDIPNRFTIRGNGTILYAEWVGDGTAYPNGPWQGQTLAPTANFQFQAQAGVQYTLEVETIDPPDRVDEWYATVSCTNCGF